MKINIEASFRAFAAAAVARLRYLHADCTFDIVDDAILVRPGDDTDIARVERDTRFQLYREKIYQEGLPMRTLMYQTLLS